MFNVFKYSDALKAAGVDAKLADAQARALAEALDHTDVATRSDVRELGVALRTELKTAVADLRTEIADLRTEMRTEVAGLKTGIADLRTEMRTEIADLRTEMRTEIAGLRTEMRTEVASLKTEIAHLRGGINQLQWKVGVVVAGLGVVFTILNHFLLHV